MVSIAESFYYRIFERKWRMGEAFRGPSPCMPYSVSNKQKKPPPSSLSGEQVSVLAFKLRVRAQARRFPKARGRLAWCLLCGSFSLDEPVPSREAGAAKRVPKETLRFLFAINILILFTDLSMAGLPAELKHITQRRKRKQP